MDRRANSQQIRDLIERMTALLEKTGPPLTPEPGNTFLALTEDELEHLVYVTWMDAHLFGARP